MADINKEWMEWCKQHEAFPEDFIANVMEDKDDDDAALKKAYTDSTIFITPNEFMSACAEVMALYASVADDLGVTFDSEKYAKFVARLMHKLFDETIERDIALAEYKKSKESEDM